MPWPSVAVAVGDVISNTQLNLLPIQIADSTLSGSASSFNFASIPSQFAHLQVVVHARGDTAATSTNLSMQFNGDTTATYFWERLIGQAGTASADEGTGITSINLGAIPAATATADVFGSAEVLIPNYVGAHLKLFQCLNGYRTSLAGGAGSLILEAGMWDNGTGINRVTIFPSAGSFVSGSRATLYGLA